MMKRIRNVNELEVGKVYRYISPGFTCDSASVSKNAEYDAKVIQITPHIVALRMLIDQSTINRMCVWEPSAYNWSIQVRDINSGLERIYEETYRYEQ